MMVQRRHPEYPLAGEFEGNHLHDHRDRLQNEQTADDGQHQFMLDGHGYRTKRTAKGE